MGPQVPLHPDCRQGSAVLLSPRLNHRIIGSITSKHGIILETQLHQPEITFVGLVLSSGVHRIEKPWNFGRRVPQEEFALKLDPP
jgi:hypothetical protein